MVILLSTRGTAGSDIWFMCLAEKPMVRSYHLGANDWTPLSQNPVQICNDSWFLVARRHSYTENLVKMPHAHDNATSLSIKDACCSCARTLALATRFPITCRRLGFRSGCCKYVEQCKTAIYWDLAFDFILVRIVALFNVTLSEPHYFFSFFFAWARLKTIQQSLYFILKPRW